MVLYEPTVCGYVLTFESSISCEILDFADKHGIPDDLHEISDDSEPKTEEELDDDKVVNPTMSQRKTETLSNVSGWGTSPFFQRLCIY